jgi:hypothetical protein
LDGLLQPGKHIEDFDRTENQAIFVEVIQAGLAQADSVEAPEPRDRQRRHGKGVVEFVVVLAPVDFRSRGPVVRALDCLALKVKIIQAHIMRPERVVRWRDPDPIEIKANPLACFVL